MSRTCYGLKLISINTYKNPTPTLSTTQCTSIRVQTLNVVQDNDHRSLKEEQNTYKYTMVTKRRLAEWAAA